MSYIRMISESDASGELSELYAALTDPDHGGVDNILKIHSLDVDGLKAHLAVYRSAMAGTATLRKVERELIAVVVSTINACHYWIAHHSRGLRKLLKDDELCDQVLADWRSAPLSSKRRVMLNYAAKLTRTPSSMTQADVHALTIAGFSDEDILGIVEVIAYYAYANRIADGLGVQLEG